MKQAALRATKTTTATLRPVAVDVRSPKTAELVADHIRHKILSGTLKEGDFLQPEQQLMEAFSVSRPTLREACRILENEDFISVVRGSRSGARVRLPRMAKIARYATFLLQGQRAELHEIYEARQIIEPALVAELAQRHSVRQIAGLRDSIRVAQETLETGDRRAIAVDVGLIHKAIVEQYGNKPLGLFANMLQHIVETHQASVGARTTEADPTYRKRVMAGLKSMTKLVDLVEKGDADGAAAHWRLHLKNANARWLSGYDNTTLLDLLE